MSSMFFDSIRNSKSFPNLYDLLFIFIHSNSSRMDIFRITGNR